ncbi:MAG: twin-arginine translocase subunit TatC [Methylophilaceae bacterium]|nr:twin-arginine translocase subunit TatC [Methylophilaceae bacterium]
MNFPQAFSQNFKELRWVLIKSFLILVAIFLLLFPFANEIYYFFAKPLLIQMQSVNASIISTKLTATFIVPFKITLFCAFLISLPLIFWQIWLFVSPGLYRKEKFFIFWALLISYILFIFGTLFVYSLVFPIIFNFFISMTPNEVDLMVDISTYLEMIITLFLAFGFAFQVPIILVTLVKFKWVRLKSIQKNRSFLIVIAFIFGAIFTPPDVISQILLALPMIILFELGVLIAKKITID